MNAQTIIVPEECVRCGRLDHTTQNCVEMATIEGMPINTPVCHRCGHENHYASRCRAKRTKWGRKLRRRQTEQTVFVGACNEVSKAFKQQCSTM
uniref:CCHC-type zinc finger protein n=1 Tax=Clandestinovirus TaxID=2831644 RepID=A0A8F8KL32_9VIRU|nr:CCHC-type zinc finger protein [Clandestinovirus]